MANPGMSGVLKPRRLRSFAAVAAVALVSAGGVAEAEPSRERRLTVYTAPYGQATPSPETTPEDGAPPDGCEAGAMSQSPTATQGGVLGTDITFNLDPLAAGSVIARCWWGTESNEPWAGEIAENHLRLPPATRLVRVTADLDFGENGYDFGDVDSGSFRAWLELHLLHPGDPYAETTTELPLFDAYAPSRDNGGGSPVTVSMGPSQVELYLDLPDSGPAIRELVFQTTLRFEASVSEDIVSGPPDDPTDAHGGMRVNAELSKVTVEAFK